MGNNDIRVAERYESFKNIDCFENACVVLDNMFRVLENPESNNLYWKKVTPSIGEAYYKRDFKLDVKEEILYFVCANVFYLEELFEMADDEAGLRALSKCEQECC